MLRSCDIRITALFVDFRLRLSSAAERYRIVGVQPDGLVEIGNGSVKAAFFLISQTTVAKGGAKLGIKSNGFGEIGDGPVVVAFVAIDDPSATKSYGVVGI